jgi:hypothetical protein
MIYVHSKMMIGNGSVVLCPRIALYFIFQFTEFFNATKFTDIEYLFYTFTPRACFLSLQSMHFCFICIGSKGSL